MQDKMKDLFFATGLLLVGIIALVVINATTAQSRIASSATLTFATLPSVYAGLLIFLVLIFMATTFRDIQIKRMALKDGAREHLEAKEKEKKIDKPSDFDRKKILFRTWGALILLIIYVIMLEYMHFMIITTLFLCGMFFLFGQRSIKQVAAISICGGLAFYLLFIYALNLPI